MYPYNHEDVAWQRLLDMQREMENSRWWAAGERPDWYRWITRNLTSVARAFVQRRAEPALDPEGQSETGAETNAA